MKKLNNYTRFGLLLFAVCLVSTRFGLLPAVIEGFCLGISIVLELFGLYASGHDISKLRSYKINFLKKCLGR